MKKDLENTAAFLIIIFCCLLFLSLVGCGKKGDPVPRRQPVLSMIKNLAGEPTKDGILLSWTLPDNTKKAKTFKILRFVAISGEDCPGCPREFVLLTERDEAALQSGEKDPGKYRYLDRNIDTGKDYAYRIVWCISSRICSPQSNIADIKSK